MKRLANLQDKIMWIMNIKWTTIQNLLVLSWPSANCFQLKFHDEKTNGIWYELNVMLSCSHDISNLQLL